MAGRKGEPAKPKPLRVRVDEGTPGAYLWAPFGEHMKAALASLFPFLVLLVVGNSGQAPADASAFERIWTGINLTGLLFATGGFILGPAIVGIYSIGWGLMSNRLLFLLRRRDGLIPHVLSYAVGGAASLFTATMLVLWLVQLGKADPMPINQIDGFAGLAIATPLVGAVGAVLGLFALRLVAGWYVTRDRPPLPDVFRFVEGKRDRDEFERM